MYGRGNVYLRLGDRLSDLVTKIGQRMVTAPLGEPNPLLLAVLTIIQYVEKMGDAEVAASIQHRMDLRYALHLPTPSPRLDPHYLCVFRSTVLMDPERECLFEELFHIVYPEITSNANQEEPPICDVLNSICDNEIRVSLIEAMLHAVEALSANHFHWLRQIALPHWYQRYNQSMLGASLDQSRGKQELSQDDVQGDIQYLLYEVHESSSQDIMKMREIKDLSLMWEQLTGFKFMKDCKHCIRKHY